MIFRHLRLHTIVFCLVIAALVSSAQAVERITISGTVRNQNGIALNAMILANGQYMFSHCCPVNC